MATNEQLQKLQNLENAGVRTSNRVSFNDLVCVEIGVKPVEHFPKVKDREGKNIKDAEGKDERSKQSDGWQYTFSQFGTGHMVKVVLSKHYQMSPLSVYKISGLGYDMRQANMIFIDEAGRISNY